MATRKVSMISRSNSTFFSRVEKKKFYLIVDESSQCFDLQHVGLMSSQLMNKTVCSSVVPTNTEK